MSTYQLEQLESEKPGVIIVHNNEKVQIVIDELVDTDCQWWKSSDIPVRFAVKGGGQLSAKVRFSVPALIQNGDRIVANISRSDNQNAQPDHFEGQIIQGRDGKFWFDGTVAHRFSKAEINFITGMEEDDETGRTVSTEIQFPLDELSA